MKPHIPTILLGWLLLAPVARSADSTTVLGTWEWRNPVPRSHALRDVARGSVYWVAVGEYGTILNSTDGITWEAQISGVTNHLSGVRYGNGSWVAVGEQGVVLTSSDSRIWTRACTPLAVNLTSVAWGRQRWVVASTSGSFLVSGIGSPENWQIINTPTDRELLDVAHADGRWIAVGAAATILNSTDGIEWSAVESNAPFTLRTVGHDGIRWVAAGERGALVTSTDGMIWEDHSLPAVRPFPQFEAIAFGNGGWWGVGGSDSYYSPDGIEWVAVPSIGPEWLVALAYSDGLWITVGGNTILTSTDGSIWTERKSGPTSALYSVCHADGRFVAVGDHGTVLSSTDSREWTRHTTGTETLLMSVAYGNGRWVAVGGGGGIIHAVELENWNVIPTSDFMNGVAWGDGKWLAVGSQGSILESSDGSDWKESPSPTRNGLLGATHGGGLWMVYGIGGRVWSSPDASTWTLFQFPSDGAIRQIAYVNGTWIAVGDIGIWRSTDGLEWVPVDSPQSWPVNAVTWTGELWVGVGELGDTLSSTDGLTWAPHYSPTLNRLHGLAAGAGVVVAVGDAGTILSAPLGLASGSFRLPLDGEFTISTPFGGSTTLDEGRTLLGHLGEDYAAPHGSPVFAVADGVVVLAGRDDPCHLAFGNEAVVKHQFFPKELFAQYGHLAELAVISGQPVVAGQIIGWLGTTGLSTGPHLHFAIGDSELLGPGYAGVTFDTGSFVRQEGDAQVTLFRPSSLLETHRVPLTEVQAVVIGTGLQGLRLRQQPLGSILAVLPEGTLLNVSGETETAGGIVWRRVVLGDQMGWVASQYLRVFDPEALPNRPDPPTGLRQFRVGEANDLVFDEVVTMGSVALRAKVSGEPGLNYRIQFEIRGAGESFTQPTRQSGLIRAGETGEIRLADLPAGSYHWRARTIDEYGQLSDWVSYSEQNQTHFTRNLVPPPSALFNANPSWAAVGDTVTFLAQEWEVPALSFTWDFGDGTTSTLPIVGHEYLTPGNRTVTLRVTDEYGQSTLQEKAVSVSPLDLENAIEHLVAQTQAHWNGLLESAALGADAADYFQHEVNSSGTRFVLQCVFTALGTGLTAADYFELIKEVTRFPELENLLVDSETRIVEEVVDRTVDRLGETSSYPYIFMGSLKAMVARRTAELEALRQEALESARLLPIEQQLMLAKTLRARDSGNLAVADNHRAKAHLVSTYQVIKSTDEDSWAYAIAKISFGTSTTLLLDIGTAGFGKIGALFVGGVNAVYDVGNAITILATRPLNEQMLAASSSVFLQTGFRVHEIFANTEAGLRQVIQGTSQEIPDGNATIRHVVKATHQVFGYTSTWFVDEAIAEIRISNTGLVPATYRVEVLHDEVYETRPEYFGIFRQEYPIRNVAVTLDVHLAPNESTTRAVAFRTASEGHIPVGSIDYVLTARTPDGVYLVDRESGRFRTTIIDESGDAWEHENLPGSVLTDTPVRSGLTVFAGGKTCTLVFRAQNPLPDVLAVRVHQPLPLGTSLLHSSGGVAQVDGFHWEVEVAPHETAYCEATLNVFEPLAQPFMSAQVQMYDVVQQRWTMLTVPTQVMIIESNPSPTIVDFELGQDGVSVSLDAFTPGAYQIQYTTDLRTWEPGPTVVSRQGRILMLDPDAPLWPIRLYRAARLAE